MLKGFLIAACVCLPHIALASLGDPDATVERDRRALGAPQKEVRALPKFKIHEMNAHGNKIREFSTGNGKIFAISWRGIRDPDLTVLLGSFYSEYQAAMKSRAKTKGRHPLVLKTPHFTFQKSGHMRDLRGLVYLNDQLPDGTRPEDLQ